jgi:hypothetical protein
MKLNNTILGIAIGLAIGAILFHDGCGENKTDTTVTHDTVVRVTIQKGTFYKTQFVQVPIRTEIPVYIDTSTVIFDYYTYFNVKDTLIGKDYYVTLDDTLFMNRLLARTANVNITHRDSFITTTITTKKSANGLYLGAQTNLKDLSPSVMYLKGRSAYGIGYGFKEKDIHISYYYRLFGE